MANAIRFLKLAEHDVRDIVSYITENSPSSVPSFRSALEETTELLHTMPHMGSPRVSDRPVLKDIRVLPIKGFEHYYVFYRPHDTTLEIVRILHGARDYPSLFT